LAKPLAQQGKQIVVITALIFQRPARSIPVWVTASKQMTGVPHLAQCSLEIKIIFRTNESWQRSFCQEIP